MALGLCSILPLTMTKTVRLKLRVIYFTPASYVAYTFAIAFGYVVTEFHRRDTAESHSRFCQARAVVLFENAPDPACRIGYHFLRA